MSANVVFIGCGAVAFVVKDQQIQLSITIARCKGGGRACDNCFSKACVDIFGVDGEGYLVVSSACL